MGIFPNGPLVAADDTWVLWAILIVFAAASIYLEQNYRWAEKLSGPVIGLILAVIAVNLGFIPTDAPTYDVVWTYCIPLAVAMLLFKVNIKSIIKDTGTAFIAFNIVSLGTVVGAIASFFLLKNYIPEMDKLAGSLTASYIGGGVNLFAVIDSVNLSETMFSSLLIADNFVMAIFIFLLLWIPSNTFFKKHFYHPHEDAVMANVDKRDESKTMAASFWGRKEISLIDIAMTVATAFVIVTIASKVSGLLANLFAAPEGAGFWRDLPPLIFGNIYVILTLTSVVATALFPNYFAKLRGSQEIGTFLIYIFFVVIGCPANIIDVIVTAPLMFVFCLIVGGVNLGFGLMAGKIFKKLPIEEICLASNSSIGGPSTGAAMAVAKGYNSLVVTGILIGLWGYIIGTPLGLVIYRWLTTYM